MPWGNNRVYHLRRHCAAFWVLTSHIIAKLIANVELEFNQNKTRQRNPRISVVQKGSSTMMQLDAPTKFYMNWSNPFDYSRSSLINICSGIEASSEIKSDLLTACRSRWRILLRNFLDWSHSNFKRSVLRPH